MRISDCSSDVCSSDLQEYAIGSRVVPMPDFLEGVRALIVDKDNSPKWNPPTAEAVTDAWIDAIFAPLPETEQWTPLTLPCRPPFVTPALIRGDATKEKPAWPTNRKRVVQGKSVSGRVGTG